MILGLLTDPVLRASLARAASSEEDVIFDSLALLDALRHGFPRLMVHDQENQRIAERLLEGSSMHVIPLREDQVASWDAERRSAPILRSREDFATERMRILLRVEQPRPTWVDFTLRDLSRAAGAQLPDTLRGFARRVLEHPARYDDLSGFCEATCLTRGALKARFRRKRMASPSTYLRWFRVMAAAHVLRDGSVTTLEASHRLGYTSDGNFCRAVTSTTGLTPTELRSRAGWHRLVTAFAKAYLDRRALESWSVVDLRFVRRRVA